MTDTDINDLNEHSGILNCFAFPAIDPRPHEYIVAGIATKTGYWLLADSRTLKPWVGHA